MNASEFAFVNAKHMITLMDAICQRSFHLTTTDFRKLSTAHDWVIQFGTKSSNFYESATRFDVQYNSQLPKYAIVIVTNSKGDPNFIVATYFNHICNALCPFTPRGIHTHTHALHTKATQKKCKQLGSIAIVCLMHCNYYCYLH